MTPSASSSLKRKADNDTTHTHRTARLSQVDWVLVAELVMECVGGQFALIGADEERLKNAQRAMIPYFHKNTHEELFPLTVQEFIFDILKGPSLIEETERLLLDSYTNGKQHTSLLPLLTLLYEGKAPSYPEAGAGAVAKFLLNFRKSEHPWHDLDQFDVTTRNAILKQISEQEEGDCSFWLSKLFNHYLHEAFIEQKLDEFRTLLAFYIAAQPAECALTLKEASYITSRKGWILYALETLSLLPFRAKFILALLWLGYALEKEQTKWPHPSYDTPLFRILNQVQYSNLRPAELNNCLRIIVKFSGGELGCLSPNYLPILKRLLVTPVSLHSLEQAGEYLCHLDKLVETERFVEIWPFVQQQWLAAWNSPLEELILKLFVHVAYRHPNVSLIEEIRQILSAKAAQFQVEAVAEKDLLTLALVAHYDPELLPYKGPYTLQSFRLCNTTPWRALTLLKGRWTDASLRLVGQRGAHSFFECLDRDEDLIEIPLRMDVLRHDQLENKLYYYVQRHPTYFPGLLNLLNTIAQKAIEKKLLPPLLFLKEAVHNYAVEGNRSQRFVWSINVLVKTGFLDDSFLIKP